MDINEAPALKDALQAASDYRYNELLRVKSPNAATYRNWYTDPTTKVVTGGGATFNWSLADRLNLITYNDLIHLRALQKLIARGHKPTTVTALTSADQIPGPKVPNELLQLVAMEDAFDFAQPGDGVYKLGIADLNSDVAKTLRSYWFGKPSATPTPTPTPPASNGTYNTAWNAAISAAVSTLEGLRR